MCPTCKICCLCNFEDTRAENSNAAVAALGQALVSDCSSVLFRHEVAYVLGQIQNPVALPSLRESLSRQEEHSMVRHEAAEALGNLIHI